jgi:hypothetical protein
LVLPAQITAYSGLLSGGASAVALYLAMATFLVSMAPGIRFCWTFGTSTVLLMASTRSRVCASAAGTSGAGLPVEAVG